MNLYNQLISEDIMQVYEYNHLINITTSLGGFICLVKILSITFVFGLVWVF